MPFAKNGLQRRWSGCITFSRQPVSAEIGKPIAKVAPAMSMMDCLDTVPMFGDEHWEEQLLLICRTMFDSETCLAYLILMFPVLGNIFHLEHWQPSIISLHPPDPWVQPNGRMSMLRLPCRILGGRPLQWSLWDHPLSCLHALYPQCLHCLKLSSTFLGEAITYNTTCSISCHLYWQYLTVSFVILLRKFRRATRKRSAIGSLVHPIGLVKTKMLRRLLSNN